jgi:hypothetical protein
MPRNDDKGSDKGKVKVRVIEFEMEGSNSTLQESIRNIVGAIGKAQVVRVVTPALQDKKANGQEHGPIEDEEEIVAEQDDDGAADDEAIPIPRARRPRKVKPLKVVQVDLTQGEMPLKQFLASAPAALEKRYILIAYWFKSQRQIDVINPDHIYTAYMAMGWTTLPRDPGKPFRNAKEDGAFDRVEGESMFAITHIGEMKAMEILQKGDPGK